MITFQPISAATDGETTADYFLNEHLTSKVTNDEPTSQADPRDNLAAYYTGHGAKGVWRHDMSFSVANALGINPHETATRDTLARLYEGKRGDTGEKWAGATREISGYDFTFSPHKSVTLAAEFAASPAETAAIRNAIARANDDAIHYIAKELGWARKGKAGRGGADPGDVAWVSFTHYEARPTVHLKDGRHGKTEVVEAPVPADPQDHIHNTMFNVVVTEDGRIGSLDQKRLRSRVHEFGAYGQARLADELRKLGIRVAYDANEEAVVISAIPQNAVEAFSKKRKQILDAAKAFASNQGRNWNDLSKDEKMTIIGRSARAERLKKNANESNRESWRSQAKALGWEHSSVLQGFQHEALTDEQRFERAYAFAARHLAKQFRTAAVVDHNKLREFAAIGLIGTGIEGGTKDIDSVVELLEQRGIKIDGEKAGLVAAWVRTPGNKREPEDVLRVSNTTQLRIEQALVDHVQRAVSDKSGALTAAQVQAAIATSGLDFSSQPAHGAKQIAAIHAIGQGGAVTLLTGFAGSGKTTLLQPLVQAWSADTKFDSSGREIIGISSAWKQANALEDAGIDLTLALDPFLKSIDAGKIIPTRNTILIIDEVSQVGPKAMLRLFELQATTGMTIKALGDREQAQAIEAGDTIELMRRALPKEAQPELLSTVRQQNTLDRKVATLFREEAASQALDIKRENGTARLIGGDQEQVAGEIANLYLERRDILRKMGPKKRITISTLTNEDAAQISLAVRAKLKERGELGTDEVLYKAIAPRGNGEPLLFDLPIATGDHVRLYSRTWARINGKAASIGNNGDIVKVVGKTNTHITLEDQKGRIGEVEWRRLTHRETGRALLGFGHALTIDSAQGITSDEHINALPRGSAGITAFKAYVAESRARGTTWTMISEGAVKEVEKHRRPLGDGRKITEDDLWKRIADDMSHKPYKPLAIDLLQSTRLINRAAVDSFLRQSHAFHSWTASGKDPGSAARANAHDKTLTARISHHLAGLTDGVRQNAAILHNSLLALEAYLRNRPGAPAPKPDEPAPAPRPPSPSPGL